MSNDSSDEDEEIELTFDMTKTAIVETTTLTHETSDTETLEDTYASLGVTFLELTSQMQNVMKEVTSTSGKSIPSFFMLLNVYYIKRDKRTNLKFQWKPVNVIIFWTSYFYHLIRLIIITDCFSITSLLLMEQMKSE